MEDAFVPRVDGQRHGLRKSETDGERRGKGGLSREEKTDGVLEDEHERGGKAEWTWGRKK